MTCSFKYGLQLLSCRTFFTVFCLIVFGLAARAQQVNGYARVQAQSDSMLVLSHVQESHDTFEAGEQLIIIQVQDNTLGSTANSSAFGGLGSIGSAGLFEVIQIEEVRETGGIPDTLILAVNPSVSFNTGSNSRVQVVTYPELGTNGYSTTADITAREWDGNTGGVIAFRVNGNLNLAHNVLADGAGFRGGSHSNNSSQPNDCDDSVYRINDPDFGEKGEGIHFNTNSSFDHGRGRMLNGGGGGVSHNGAGGGGGNYTAGGMGGAGWNSGSGCSPSISGLGGLALSGFISPNRLFMGGGGGGAQENNNNGTDGGNGGGLIFIQADTLTTTGMCSLVISANGQSATNAGNDGGGGGGGGGSIVLDIDHFDIDGGCPMTVRANGGNGAAVTSSTVHAGGGGGGQGVIVFSGPEPITNTTAQTLNGAGGCDNSGCSSQAENGNGSDNIGILTGQPSLLADYSIEATVRAGATGVWLTWVLKGDPTEALYKVQRSRDRVNWLTVCDGTALTGTNNTCKDANLSGDWYFRVLAWPEPALLIESDHLLFTAGQSEKLLDKLYPNPATNSLHLKLSDGFIGEYRIYSAGGNLMQKQFVVKPDKLQLDISDLSPGVYQLMLFTPYNRETHRFVKTSD